MGFVFVLIVGLFSSIAGLISGLLLGLWLSLSNQNETIFLYFITILIASDSRLIELEFIKNLRPFILLLITGVLFLRGSVSFSSNKYILLFIPFFISLTISLFFSEDLETSFQKSLSYFLLFLIVPVSIIESFKRNKESLNNLLMLVILTLTLSVISIFVFPEVSFLVGRYRGLLGNPNGMAIFTLLTYLMFILLGKINLLPFSNKTSIWIHVLFIITLILCGSRSSLFAIGLYFVLNYLSKYSWFLSFIVFILFLFSYEFILESFPIIANEFGLGDYFRVKTMKEGSGRLIAWSFAWTEIQNHWYFGKGISYTEQLFSKNYFVLSKLGHQGNAHQSFLTLWLDTGLIGLSLFVLATIGVIVKSLKKHNFVLAILFPIYFSAFFESWMAASLNPFMIFYVIILTLLINDWGNKVSLTKI